MQARQREILLQKGSDMKGRGWRDVRNGSQAREHGQSRAERAGKGLSPPRASAHLLKN